MTAAQAETRTDGRPELAEHELPKPPAIEVHGLTRVFGATVVLESIDLMAPRGEILGLVGPSGCGKTTLVKILTGVLRPTEGEVRVGGADPARFTTADRGGIGYMPQGFILYPTLTVRENVNFVAGLYGVGWWQRRKRVPAMLRFLELWDARGRLARDISGGMQRRLSLAAALVHKPAILIVDEPTAGLDPLLRMKIWDFLRGLRDGGTTVLVTTQYLDEAGNCDRLAVMNQGRIVAMGEPEELRRRAAGGEAIDIDAGRISRDAIAALWRLPMVRRVDWESPDCIRVSVEDTAERAIPSVTEVLLEHGVQVEAVRPYIPSFDEAFVALVHADNGKPQREREEVLS